MTAVPKRVLFLTAAVLATVVAIAVAGYVIPPVRTTWVPNTDGAGGSIPAFWVSVGGNLLFAALLAFCSVAGRRSRQMLAFLAILGAGALVQAFAFFDATRAFSSSPLRTEMGEAIAALRIAAAADVTAGLLVLLVALRDRLAR